MRRLCLLIWLVMAASTGVADAQMSEVLRKVPPAANAILLVDVPAVHNSHIGREKGWKDAHARDFATVPIKVPPESELVVISSSLNPELNFKRDWELALILTKEAFSPRSIARSEGGYIDSIRSYNAVWSPSDAYIVPLSSSEIAVQTPANRQQIARWLDWTQKNSVPGLEPKFLTGPTKLDVIWAALMPPPCGVWRRSSTSARVGVVSFHRACRRVHLDEMLANSAVSVRKMSMTTR